MRRLVPLLAVLAVSAHAAPSAAQDSCWLDPTTHRLDVRTENGARVFYTINPVVTCSGGARITADEGTLYEAHGEVHLIGHVNFTDPDRSLTSDQAVYTSSNGRLHAIGNVVFADRADGMTIRGPDLEYYRAIPGRPETNAVARFRPQLTMQPRQRAGAEPRPGSDEPVIVDSDEMIMTGNDRYTAVGRVEIRRSDFQAFSSRAEMDQIQERIELRGNSRVQSEQFDLTGDWIDMAMPGDRLETVLARRHSTLVGDELRVDAPDIHLFFEEDELQRMVARNGDSPEDDRPIASARGFRLEADSLDALMPAQQLERVVAVGNARGETVDTVGVPRERMRRPLAAGDLASGEVDWITGDTVTGFFSRIAAPATPAEAEPSAELVPAEPDSREEVVLERLLAVGSARSLYRLANDRQENGGRPGINYLIGEAIELTFAEGELEVADVRGLSRGLYLDPEPAPPAPEAAEDEEEEPTVEPAPEPETAHLSPAPQSRRWRR
jgi:lipopolysaccharide export system protein LptA